MKKLKIALCQPTYIHKDIDSAIKKMIKYSIKADRHDADLICFPECFLQGYVVNQTSKKLGIDLNSKEFKIILNRLKDISVTIIFGMIESNRGKIYNTAVMIKQGVLLGYYRKINLIGTEKSFFQAGTDFPIFSLNEIKLGISICYDTNFNASFQQVKRQGGDLIICLSNNMMSAEKSKKWKDEHNRIRSEKCKENQIWLASSDVTGEYNGKVSHGPTAIINDKGVIISELILESEGMLIEEINFGK